MWRLIHICKYFGDKEYRITVSNNLEVNVYEPETSANKDSILKHSLYESLDKGLSAPVTEDKLKCNVEVDIEVMCCFLYITGTNKVRISSNYIVYIVYEDVTDNYSSFYAIKGLLSRNFPSISYEHFSVFGKKFNYFTRDKTIDVAKIKRNVKLSNELDEFLKVVDKQMTNLVTTKSGKARLKEKELAMELNKKLLELVKNGQNKKTNCANNS